MLTHQRSLSITFFDAYPHVVGGSHQVLLTLAGELRLRGTVHFLTTGEGLFTTELDRLGFSRTVVTLPRALMSYGHSTRSQKALLAAYSLPIGWRQIRRCIPPSTDVLHTNDLRGALLAGPPARSLRIPVIWQVHLGENTAALNRLAGYAATSIVVPDASTVLSSPGLPAHKLTVVPNAVQPDALLEGPIRRGRTLLVTSSRLVPQKGLDLLLEAVALVRRSFPEVQLHIYGGDQTGYSAYAQWLRSLITELDLDNTVTMRGHFDRPYRCWSEAAVYVQASRWENYPVAVLEAMARGLPVVATDVGAMAKIIEQGRTGILVPPNDPPALAEAIKRLLDSPPDAGVMGSAGRERVLQDFAPSAMTNRMVSIYEAVASGRT